MKSRQSTSVQLTGPQFKNTKERGLKILEILQKAMAQFPAPMSLQLKEIFGPDSFVILISCLLSLRARDIQTLPVSLELFKRARTPRELLDIPIQDLEKILYSLGYYKQKAKILREVCQQLLRDFNGTVPSTIAQLRSLKYVGPKTANLVASVAFGQQAICVDIHVHRISNRLGLVVSKTPEETEQQLQELFPQQYWTQINELFVTLGQNICVPISPKCSICPVRELCPRVGVTIHR